MNIRDVGLRANADALRICETILTAGKKIGKQWVVGDAAGNPGDSMQVELEGPKCGQWYDHAAGEGGDMLTLVKLNRGLPDIIAAADVVRGILGLPEWKPFQGKTKAEALFDPKSKPWKIKGTEQWVKPVKTWAYHSETGEIIAYVCRIEWVEDGKSKKDVLPMRKDDAGEWKYKGWRGTEKRPLYDLHQVSKQNDGRPLLIVEGEKTADAAKVLFSKFAVTTWPGGCRQVDKADWSIVASWKGPIVIWPDNDDEGHTAALYLKGRFPAARKVKLPKEIPHKWDLADPIPEGVSVKALADAAIDGDEEKNQVQVDTTIKPYIPLGVDEMGYYFLSRAEGFLLHYTPAQLTELNIWRIAPDPYWESLGYYKEKSNRVDFTKVAKVLMAECQLRGAYDSSVGRGRGVWMDRGRVVIHLGHKLIVDGKEMNLVDIESDYVYLRRPPILSYDPNAKPITAAQSARLIELFESCTWQTSRSAYLLAGWMWAANMCGILPWRPHWFMQGVSSSGKTWLIGHAITPLLGEFCHSFMANSSSEAGARQTMSLDALTFILDEFDAEHIKQQEKLDMILGLARQSSSDTGGKAVKGSVHGIAKTFSLKSCFMFVGTAPAMFMKSDLSRVTTAELRKAGPEDNNFSFEKIQQMAAETTENPEYVKGFLARQFGLVRETLDSVEVFRRLASRVLKDTRAGDQYGVLLGCSWMVFNDTPPTEQQAKDYMLSMDWSDLIPTESETDHVKASKALLGFRIDFDDCGKNSRETVGRLLERAFDPAVSEDGRAAARRGLSQFGINMDFDRVQLAKGHRGIETIFRGTPYWHKWETHFSRFEGAQQEEIRISGARYRCISIPYSVLASV